MQEAVDLLQPLLTDTVDYVKQGALIATALVLMQQPESKVSFHCCCSYAWQSCLSHSTTKHSGKPCDKVLCIQSSATMWMWTTNLLQACLGCGVSAEGHLCQGYCCAQVVEFRKLVDGKIGDKHEEVMSRMGAIMAAGILDAGANPWPPCIACFHFHQILELQI